MPIVYHRDMPVESFPDCVTDQTLVGSVQTSAPLRIGIKVSPPGMTLSFPVHLQHGFRATGNPPSTPYGVHVSPERVVHIHEE
jgi:hypothetical protein